MLSLSSVDGCVAALGLGSFQCGTIDERIRCFAEVEAADGRMFVRFTFAPTAQEPLIAGSLLLYPEAWDAVKAALDGRFAFESVSYVVDENDIS